MTAASRHAGVRKGKKDGKKGQTPPPLTTLAPLPKHPCLPPPLRLSPLATLVAALANELLELVVLAGLLSEVRHHRHRALLDLPARVALFVHLFESLK